MTDPTLSLRVSSMGRQCGFVSVDDGQGGHFSVVVLPKLWAPTPTTRVVDHPPGADTTVTAYELDTLLLRTTASTIASIAVNIANVEQAGERQLLTPAAKPDNPRRVHDAQTNDAAFVALLQLLALSERGGVRLTTGPAEAADDSGLTRVLLQRRFLDALLPVLRTARPRYVELTETLTSPRGRLHDESLAISIASGQPAVRATYDELTMDTPVLRVVRAALTVIAAETPPTRWQAVAGNTQQIALGLVGRLPQGQLLPPLAAAHLAATLRLGYLDRRWEPVLRFAAPVLREQASVPSAELRTGHAVVLHLPTEKLWEQLCRDALQSVTTDVRETRHLSPAPGVNVPRPWHSPKGHTVSDGPLDQRYPDYMFDYRGVVTVADAKYKATRLTSSDGYQLFTYSHLATLDGRPARAGILLYPGPPGSPPREAAAWQRRPHNDFVLWAVTLPFPAPAALASTARWADHQTATHQRMADGMTQLRKAAR